MVESVEWKKLYPGDPVDLFGAKHIDGALHYAVGSSVTVMKRVLDQSALLAQQSVIDAPGVDSDGIQASDTARCKASQGASNLKPQPRRIPMQPAIVVNGLIREAADFL